jgi:hypothetical protein
LDLLIFMPHQGLFRRIYLHNMKKRFLSLCIFLPLVLTGYSQQNYLPGIIVKLKGDTLRGLINNQNAEKNPLNIYFRRDMNHNPDIFSPQEVQSFTVADEIYISATVSLNEGFYETQELSNSPEIKLQTETVFLQALVRGNKSLYYLKDSKGREQFYVELDSRYELLIYHKYLKNLTNSGDIAGANTITEDKRYIGQLSYYLSDCPNIQSSLRNLKLSKQSLVKLFRQYYDCINANAEYEKKSDETKAEFGVIGGLSLTSLKFKADEGSFDELINSDFPVSPSIAFGIYYNKKLSRNLGRLSLYNELFFSGYKTDAFYKVVVNENRYVNNNISFGGIFIKMNNMLQYTFPVKSISLMVRFGISNGYNLSETNQNDVEYVFYSTSTKKTIPAIEGTRKYAFGLAGGIGGSYKRFSLDIKYEHNSGMSDMPALYSPVGVFYLMVGYRF